MPAELPEVAVNDVDELRRPNEGRGLGIMHDLSFDDPAACAVAGWPDSGRVRSCECLLAVRVLVAPAPPSLSNEEYSNEE